MTRIVFATHQTLEETERVRAQLVADGQDLWDASPAVGGHGAEFRIATSQPPALEKAWLDLDLKRRLVGVGALDRRILVEDKGYAVAIHYRLAPEMQPLVEDAIEAALASAPSSRVEVLHGKARARIVLEP